MATKKKKTAPRKPAKKSTVSLQSSKKIAQKPARKKVSPKVSLHQETPINSPLSSATETKQKNIQKISRKSFVATFIIILIIIGLLYIFRSSFVVATVNGVPISRMSFNTEMEKETGKRALDALITKELILQEANKRNITVSKQEIDAEMKNISDTLGKQGQKLDEALIARGITQDDLREQIRMEKIIEKLLSKEIQVTDKEATDYMNKYNSSIDANNANSDTTGTQATGAATQKITKAEAKQQLQQQKLADKLQPWIQQLQSKAKITKFVNF